ncbi:cytochrome P450 [Pseudonocardia sp. HH130630-07]|uniref:cytochrome P450 n=1 Tax=Pseudonocardia sp. HH130630-07 TaxID=1690815 RepID=UPI00081506CE|nr:cytochrome P450 [Pseudonocardia sp. HH130630-07]ANY07675.1 cytochrome [Pseudonocardia sp. HH130630-07]
MTGARPRPLGYPLSEQDEPELDPGYAALRRDEPLTRIRMRHGADGWLVTRYDDVRTVLSDPRFSRAAVVGADVPRTVPERPGQPESIISIDPPEHGRLRRLVTAAFTARRVAALARRVAATAGGLVDDLVARGAPGELVSAVAMPLPVVVICELLGVPAADRDTFRAAADAVMSTSAIPVEQRQRALLDLRRTVAALLPERRDRPEGPGDDVLGGLVAARDDDGDRLSEDELVSLVTDILIAGHETTMNMIGTMVRTLLAERSRWEALVAAPEAIPAAVEEMLRFVPLTRREGLPRIATEDVALTGGTVRAGEAVVVSLAAANRDPEVFDAPEELRPGRAPGAHVAFGFGPHHCLGAALARMELQTVLRVLTTRLPALDLAGPVEWRATSMIRGPARLPVSW